MWGNPDKRILRKGISRIRFWRLAYAILFLPSLIASDKIVGLTELTPANPEQHAQG